MAWGSQTLVYNEALLDYYFERFDQESTVIFEIMFKSLYETETSEKPYPPYITRYYQLLPGKYIKHWNFKDALFYQYIPILGNRQDAINAIEQEQLDNFSMKSLPLPEVKEIDTLSAEIESAVQYSDEPTQLLEDMNREEMVAKGRKTAQAFMTQSGNQELGEEYDALIRMIKKCKEKNIKILLITAPTLPCFYEAFPKEYMEKFYRDIHLISQTYQIPYTDYTGDKRFLADYRWYYDTNHLGTGAIYFTNQFVEDNKEIFDSFLQRNNRKY